MSDRTALAKVLYIADNWRYADAANDWDAAESEGGRHPYYVLADGVMAAGYVKAES